MRLTTLLAVVVMGMAHPALAIDGDPSPLRQWTGAISAAIHGRMNPQAVAGTSGGTAFIRFTVLRSGEVRDVSLARSSGNDQIDKVALAAVWENLPVAPAGVTQPSLTISMPLQYRVRQPVADPACQWSKSQRTDLSLRCAGDDVAASRPASPHLDQTADPSIPDHDIDSTCGKLSSNEARAYCVKNEQLNYNLLKSLWVRASTRVKRTGMSIAAGYMSSASYYEALLTFLQAEMQKDEIAADRASPPRFMR